MDFVVLLAVSLRSLLTPAGIIFALPILFVPGVRNRAITVVVCGAGAGFILYQQRFEVARELGLRRPDLLQDMTIMVSVYAVLAALVLGVLALVRRARAED